MTIRLVEASAAPVNPGFVETPVARAIFEVLECSAETGKPGLVIGTSGIGKTATIAEFRRRNPDAVMVRANEAVSKANGFLRMLILALGPNPESTWGAAELYRACVVAMSSRSEGPALLIIDEAQQLNPLQARIVRNLADETACGIVLAGEPLLGKLLKHPTLTALARRIGHNRYDCERLEKADLDMIAAAYGLDGERRRLLDRLAGRGGFGIITECIEAARETDPGLGLPALQGAARHLRVLQ